MSKAYERAVEAMFYDERDRFAQTFPVVGDVDLVIIDDHYDADASERDVAWYEIAEHTVYLARKALWRSMNCLRGVFRHELGHAADPDINKAGCERRADSIAEIATGVPIRYTAEGIQHATHGEPYRPDWLHQ